MFGLNLESFVTVMGVLGLVIGVIGAFVIFFWFMSRKNEQHFSGMLKKAYDFLHFRFYIIEGILKFSYVLMACLCTTVGVFLMISIVAIAHGLLLLTVGNLLVRIAYEFILMMVSACRSLGEMNDRMKAEQELGEYTALLPVRKEPDEREEILVREAAASEEESVQECFCPQCGTKCSAEYTYCNICGGKLHK